MENMKLSELKAKTPAELLEFAETYEVENASTMRKQELMFAILKELAAREVDITGEGVVEVLPDRDVQGITALLASHVMFEILALDAVRR